MKIFRSIISLVLILATTLLVSCGSPSASAPPTYTPEILQKVKTYRIPVDVARNQMSELGEFISAEDWVDTKTFIHGPLGFLRRDMRYLADTLLPDDQEQANEIAKEIFEHFEDIDAAAGAKNYASAIKEYKEAISDFDAFFELVPDTSAS